MLIEIKLKESMLEMEAYIMDKILTVSEEQDSGKQANCPDRKFTKQQ